MSNSLDKLTLDKAWNTRRRIVLMLFVLAGIGLLFRMLHLQVFDHEFYLKQGVARQQRVVDIPAHRGNILDRHGEPIAVSTPIDSVWAVPEDILDCLLYTSPSPRDATLSRMPSSA